MPSADDGDLVIRLSELKHKVFRRDGRNLHAELPISLQEALLGFSKSIKHLDGSYVQISSENLRSQVAQADEVVKIPRRGMPDLESGVFGSRFGDLFVKLKIEFPRKLSDRQRSQLMQILV